MGAAAYRALVVCGFLVSRAAFFAVGVRFDTSPLSYFWQLLDPELLRERLAQSLFYLHAQPPLFNLLVGLDLKLFPSHYGSAFQLFALALGLVFVLAVFELGLRLGIRCGVAAAAALLLSVSPSAVLYEDFLFYDHLVAVLVMLSALLLAWYLARPGFLRGLLFFLTVAALCLIRPLFHLLWLVLVLLGLAFVRPRQPGRLLAAAALPLALVVAVYAKNAVVFHTFPEASSWTGENLARTTLLSLSERERRRLVAEGKLSPIALLPLFQRADRYRAVLPLRRPNGIPALDQLQKSTGAPNLNNASEIDVARRYLKADLWVIRHRPGAYLGGIAYGLHLFFSPKNPRALYARNFSTLEPWRRLYDTVVYGVFPGTAGAGVFLVAAYLLAFALGLRDLLKQRLDPLRAYLLATTAYVLLIGCVIDAGENYRARVIVDPFIVLLLAAAAAPRPRRPLVAASTIANPSRSSS